MMLTRMLILLTKDLPEEPIFCIWIKSYLVIVQKTTTCRKFQCWSRELESYSSYWWISSGQTLLTELQVHFSTYIIYCDKTQNIWRSICSLPKKRLLPKSSCSAHSCSRSISRCSHQTSLHYLIFVSKNKLKSEWASMLAQRPWVHGSGEYCRVSL